MPRNNKKIADYARIVAKVGRVVWSFQAPDKHRIRYSDQIEDYDEQQAAEEFGLCVRHQAECDGLFS